MLIRPPTQSDRPAWEALYAGYAAFYGVAQTPEMRATVWGWIHDPTHSTSCLVAEHAGSLVGLAHYRPFARPLSASTGGFLDDLFVDPAARGSGAAAALIDALKTRAQENGWSVLRWITAKDNARARALYDKLAQETAWVTYDIKL